MSKKIVNDLDDETLMKIALNSKEEVISDAITDAARFIYALGIKHGDEKIPTALVWYTYKQWRRRGGSRDTKANFFRNFRKYFDQHRDKYNTYYLLNPKPFDLSDETKWLIRAEQRNEKARRSNGKKEKIQRSDKKSQS